jgi:peptidoglycan-N-acetylglucosamine deacetylase
MNIITFDIEEWFHCDFITEVNKWENYEIRIFKNTERILDVLSENKLKATFFCMGWIAQKYPDILKQIKSRGHEIGCHSNMHELVYRQNKKQFWQDTQIAIKSIEDITGDKINMFRAPAFSINRETRWAFEVLAEFGIEYDSSVFPAARDYGGFPTFGESTPSLININGYLIKEFPINTIKIGPKKLIFSGGGYFRLFPYPLIAHWTKNSNYVMAYMHPRDFDPEQPMLQQLPLIRKFKSYYGLKKAFPKFKRWINDFEFVSLGDADSKTDWSKAKTINI